MLDDDDEVNVDVEDIDEEIDELIDEQIEALVEADEVEIVILAIILEAELDDFW